MVFSKSPGRRLVLAQAVEPGQIWGLPFFYLQPQGCGVISQVKVRRQVGGLHVPPPSPLCIPIQCFLPPPKSGRKGVTKTLWAASLMSLKSLSLP